MWRAWKVLRSAGVDRPLAHTMGMFLRGSIRDELLTAIDTARAAQLSITPFQLEAHYLAGGRPGDLVAATVRLEENGKPVDHQILATIDLHRGDLEGIVEDCLQEQGDAVGPSLEALADRLQAEHRHPRQERAGHPPSDDSAKRSPWLKGWGLNLLFGLLFLIFYLTSRMVSEDSPAWIEAISLLTAVAMAVLAAVTGKRKIIDRARRRQLLILILILVGALVWLGIELR